jgi:hypothetical protein
MTKEIGGMTPSNRQVSEIVLYVRTRAGRTLEILS